MTDQNRDSQRDLWMLGAVITVPMILLSGPLAGYVVGFWFLVGKLNWPPFWGPVFVALGTLGAAIQIYQLIRRIQEFDKKRNLKL